MGRVIARVVGGGRPWFISVINTALLAILPIAVLTKNVDLLIMITVVLASFAIVATIIIILPRTVVVTFTEGELLVSGRRGGFSLPRDVVVAGNVVCIEWDSRGRSYRMRVAYGGQVYTISLMNKRLVDKMVDRLRRNWGWTPPEC